MPLETEAIPGRQDGCMGMHGDKQSVHSPPGGRVKGQMAHRHSQLRGSRTNNCASFEATGGAGAPTHAAWNS
jgi:hypothetical protein